jgi:glycosyltransferase involved in cell wall biosynthesis
MNVLLVNKFLYPKGGDTFSTIATGKLLEKNGCRVAFWGMSHPNNPPYEFANNFVSCVNYEDKAGLAAQAKIALRTLYSVEARIKFDEAVRKFEPDIIHFNNFAHQISPSVLDVCAKYAIPSVMTMRDFKMVCPTYNMIWKGKPCERCKDGRYYHCLLKKCNKQSIAKSLVNMVEMYLHHKITGIYGKIRLFISPSIFMREKVLQMGFPHKVVQLYNFADFGAISPCYKGEGNYALYFGRLSPEKGINTLLNAFKGTGIPLRIVGDGPLRQTLLEKCATEGIKEADFSGFQTGQELEASIKDASFIVLPSEWYENNPRSIIEAYAYGKAAIGARIGGIPEIIRENETGMTYKAGDERDLREKMLYLARNPERAEKMGRCARRYGEEIFSPEKHYKKLMGIYLEVIGNEKARKTRE